MESGEWHVLVGCSGSVAAVKAPEISKWHGCEISGRICKLKFVATEHSLHFFSIANIAEGCEVFTDKDEWNSWSKLGDPVLHIELRKWADILLIAPLDANTLAKISNGLCDNLLTCVVRAWDQNKPLLFCPAMNTLMYENPITFKHLSQLEDFGYTLVPCVKKKLACGDTGIGGMASVDTIKNYTFEALVKYLEGREKKSEDVKVSDKNEENDDSLQIES